MFSMGYLLDTNIVSLLLRDDTIVKTNLRKLAKQGCEVCISCLTYFEIKQGLLYVNPTHKLSLFGELCKNAPYPILG